MAASLVTVYVIEPDCARRDRIARALSGHVRSVVRLESTQAWLDLDQLAPSACVVVGLDSPGVPILEFIAHAAPACPVIVTGETDDLDTVVDAMRAGATNFLDRPWDDRRLRAAVRDASRADSP